MPIYRYKAVNAAGDLATGELDAANESEIVERLRDQGMLPMQVARATGAAAGTAGVRAEPSRAATLVRLQARQPRPAARHHARARDAAPGGPPARSRARDPDRARGVRAVHGAPAADPRRRARRQVAVAGARHATRRVLPFLHQYRARGRGGRRARRGADAPRRHDGAQQGPARERQVGAHLSHAS